MTDHLTREDAHARQAGFSWDRVELAEGTGSLQHDSHHRRRTGRVDHGRRQARAELLLEQLSGAGEPSTPEGGRADGHRAVWCRPGGGATPYCSMAGTLDVH